MIAQTQFHLLTNSVYQRLISSPSLTPEETLNLQKPMEEWYANLPDYLKQQPTISTNPESESLALVRRRLMWRDWNLRTLIYRPILLRWAARKWTPTAQAENEDPLESECRTLCLRNARLSIASISEYMDNYVCTRLGAWYMLYDLHFPLTFYQYSSDKDRYFLFQAGLIPIIFLMTDPTSMDARGWLQDIQTTKQLLSHPSLSNNRLAARCLEVINKLCAPVAYYYPMNSTIPAANKSAVAQGAGMAGMGVEAQNNQSQGQGLGQAQGQGQGQGQSQSILMHFPDQFFNDPAFGGIFPDVDQELNLNLNGMGMDFSEWLNFTP